MLLLEWYDVIGYQPKHTHTGTHTQSCFQVFLRHAWVFYGFLPQSKNMIGVCVCEMNWSSVQGLLKSLSRIKQQDGWMKRLVRLILAFHNTAKIILSSHSKTWLTLQQGWAQSNVFLTLEKSLGELWACRKAFEKAFLFSSVNSFSAYRHIKLKKKKKEGGINIQLTVEVYLLIWSGLIQTIAFPQ